MGQVLGAALFSVIFTLCSADLGGALMSMPSGRLPRLHRGFVAWMDQERMDQARRSGVSVWQTWFGRVVEFGFVVGAFSMPVFVLLSGYYPDTYTRLTWATGLLVDVAWIVFLLRIHRAGRAREKP